MKRLIFLLIFVICLNINISAFAQIKLDKYREKLEIRPAQTVNGSVIVENGSARQISVKAYLNEFKFLPPFDGKNEILPAGSTPYSFGNWITISPAVFNMAPLAKQKVVYSIKVPQDAKGGYYGVIFFEEGASGDNTALGIVLRVGYTLSLETKDKIREVKIEDTAAEENSIEGKFLNPGNVILICDSTYYLMDKKGIVFDRGAIIKKIYLPPREKVPFRVNIAKEVPQGNYTLVVNFNSLDPEKREVLVKEIDISKDKAGNLKIINVRD